MSKYATVPIVWVASIAITAVVSAYTMYDYVTAKQDQRILEAVKDSAMELDKLYKGVAKIEKSQRTELKVTSDRLHDRLKRLRDRPDRPPIPASAECTCRDWRKLPRQIEEDLERLAADAQECQVAKDKSYEYADSLQK